MTPEGAYRLALRRADAIYDAEIGRVHELPPELRDHCRRAAADRWAAERYRARQIYIEAKLPSGKSAPK